MDEKKKGGADGLTEEEFKRFLAASDEEKFNILLEHALKNQEAVERKHNPPKDGEA